jgi:hypothetical protein
MPSELAVDLYGLPPEVCAFVFEPCLLKWHSQSLNLLKAQQPDRRL